jgi:hypothetical protein
MSSRCVVEMILFPLLHQFAVKQHQFGVICATKSDITGGKLGVVCLVSTISELIE